MHMIEVFLICVPIGLYYISRGLKNKFGERTILATLSCIILLYIQVNLKVLMEIDICRGEHLMMLSFLVK